MRCRTFLAVVISLRAMAGVADEHMHTHEAASPQDPPIRITINPEARVSVALGGTLPPAVTCGRAADLLVRIVNQGYVTSRLEAEFVGDPPPGVRLDFHPEPLRGLPEELRQLHITLTKPGPTDLTIAFRAHNEIPDLGGRDRIHFLMACVPNKTRDMPSARDR